MIIKNKQKSFTLIELLVVIVIIGILAGVIMISTSSSIDKANIAKVKVFEESVQNNLAANMISAWDADHVTKDTTWTLNDKWGNNNGTFYNGTGIVCSSTSGSEACPQITQDKIMGNVLSFENGYIDLGNNKSLHEKSFTIAFWIKQFDNSIRGIISKQYLPTNGEGWRLFQNAYNIEFDGYGEIGNLTVLNNIGNWVHISAVFNHNEKKMDLYKNGVLGSSKSDVIINNSNDKPLLLGYASNYFFKGSMNNIKLYNTALSSSQVKQNYIAGLNSVLANGNISKQEYNERLEFLSSN